MLEVYSPDLARLGVVEGYESLQWRRRWSEPGTFELHIAYTSDLRGLLVPENLLVKGSEAAIIESVTYSYDSDTGSTILAVGRFASVYLARRILWGTQSKTGTPEAVILALVNAALTGDRAIEHFAVHSAQGYTGDSLDYQDSTCANLLDAVSALCESSSLGMGCLFDPASGHTFRVLQGLDRTTSQTANPQAIFARSYDNLNTQEYTADQSDIRTVALVKGGDYTETVGAITGRARRELYVDAGSVDVDEEGNELDESQSRALMRTKGAQELSSRGMAETVSASTDDITNLEYKVHYDLGDVVTIRTEEWGLEWDARITEVNEIYESGGMTLDLTFGTLLNNQTRLRRLING